MKKELVCINCPTGCYLTVDYQETTVHCVKGNRCKIGVEYAEKEIVNPMRTLTSTVIVKGGDLPLVSVRTNKPIPKGMLLKTMDLLASVEVEAPLEIGQLVVADLFGLGVDVVATKNIPKKAPK
jgi:CxxC motif-containing protein